MEKDLALWNCGFLTKKHSEQQLTPSWVAEKAQQLSVALCQEKKGRETDVEVVAVVALWFPIQTSSGGAQSCWWSQSLPGDPVSVTRYTELI